MQPAESTSTASTSSDLRRRYDSWLGASTDLHVKNLAELKKLVESPEFEAAVQSLEPPRRCEELGRAWERAEDALVGHLGLGNFDKHQVAKLAAENFMLVRTLSTHICHRLVPKQHFDRNSRAHGLPICQVFVC